MVTSNYYPETSEGRAEWWQNLAEHGEAVMKKLGLPAERIAAILADAAWGEFTYGTLQDSADRYVAEVATFANAIAATPAEGGRANFPNPPKPPKVPVPPETEIRGDFETRRLDWVQEIKELAGYTREAGVALGIEPTPAVFNGGAYQTDLHDLICTGPKTVTGKFRKARGNIDGIVLRGRRQGSASWTELGRFKATPFSAPVPVTGPGIEGWEFQARALKRDIEVGLPSDIVETPVKG